ncbi:MAG: VanZ family protein [Leptolinea sp.]|nr:VanZ family protein [Leptolinea sp.]
MNKKINCLRIFSFLFLAAIVISIIAVNHRQFPASISSLYAFPNGDKVMHFVLYGVLAFIFNLSFPGKVVHITKVQLPVGSLGIFCMSIIEEISQFFIDLRTPSLLDLSCGLAGIVFLGTPAYLVAKRVMASPDTDSKV